MKNILIWTREGFSHWSFTDNAWESTLDITKAHRFSDMKEAISFVHNLEKSLGQGAATLLIVP
jgi:hypothetical protein